MRLILLALCLSVFAISSTQAQDSRPSFKQSPGILQSKMNQWDYVVTVKFSLIPFTPDRRYEEVKYAQSISIESIKSPVIVQDHAALMNYLSDKIDYPETALSAQIEGKVYLGFDLGYEGSLIDIDIVEGSDPTFSNAVKTVMRRYALMEEKTIKP